MARESKDDRTTGWVRRINEANGQRDRELEIIRFKIKEQLWSVLEPNFGTRIACDPSLANRLNAKVDEGFDNIDHIRKLNKRED